MDFSSKFDKYQKLTDEELLNDWGGCFSENLKEQRLILGMNQEELGNQIFFSKQAVYNWEKGIREPNIDTLKSLAQLFDISIDKLVE